MKSRKGLQKKATQKQRMTKKADLKPGTFATGKVNGKRAIISLRKDYDIKDVIVIEEIHICAP